MRHLKTSTAVLLTCLLGLLSPLPLHGQLGTSLPSPIFVGLDNNGNPCASCQLYLTITGTTTPQASYTTAALAIAHAHPVVLDASGRATVYLTPGLTYRVRLASALGATLWTVDGWAGVNGVSRDRLRLSPHTISLVSDAFTATYSQYAIDSEGGAATDTLTTITPGLGVGEGTLLLLTGANVAHAITLNSTGNLRLSGEYRFDHVSNSLLLYYNGGSWIEVSRGGGGGGGGQTVVFSTATGVQHNFDPGIVGDTWIILNNASPVTITGFPAGTAGQHITVTGIGAAGAIFQHLTGSAAGNQLTNWSDQNGFTTIAGGSMGAIEYRYDGVTTRWEMVSHHQGTRLVWTPSWGNTGTANTLGNGTVEGRYMRVGKQVFFTIVLVWGSTTASGNGSWSFTFPTVVSGLLGNQGAALVDTSASLNYLGYAILSSSTTFILADNARPVAAITATNPFTWADTDVAQISGWYWEP